MTTSIYPNFSTILC